MRLADLRAPAKHKRRRHRMCILFDDELTDRDIDTIARTTSRFLALAAALRYGARYADECMRFFGVAVLKTADTNDIGEVHFFLSGTELANHVRDTGCQYRRIWADVIESDNPVPAMLTFLRRHRLDAAYHWSVQLMQSMAELLIDRWTAKRGVKRETACAQLRAHVLAGAGVRTLAAGESVWWKQ